MNNKQEIDPPKNQRFFHPQKAIPHSKRPFSLKNSNTSSQNKNNNQKEISKKSRAKPFFLKQKTRRNAEEASNNAELDCFLQKAHKPSKSVKNRKRRHETFTSSEEDRGLNKEFVEEIKGMNLCGFKGKEGKEMVGENNENGLNIGRMDSWRKRNGKLLEKCNNRLSYSISGQNYSASSPSNAKYHKPNVNHHPQSHNTRSASSQRKFQKEKYITHLFKNTQPNNQTVLIDSNFSPSQHLTAIVSKQSNSLILHFSFRFTQFQS